MAKNLPCTCLNIAKKNSKLYTENQIRWWIFANVCAPGMDFLFDNNLVWHSISGIIFGVHFSRHFIKIWHAYIRFLLAFLVKCWKCAIWNSTMISSVSYVLFKMTEKYINKKIFVKVLHKHAFCFCFVFLYIPSYFFFVGLIDINGNNINLQAK